MKKRSIIFLLILVLSLAFSSTMGVSAGENFDNMRWKSYKNNITTDYINDFSSLVKNDLDYIVTYANFTEYKDIIETAANNWSDTGLIGFESSYSDISLFITQEDLGSNGIISSYVVEDNIRYIVINTFYFDSYTDQVKEYVLTHELGHAIGLVDIKASSSSIMVEYFDTEQSRISVLDQLMLVNLLNLEGSNFGEEFYESVSNMCELSVLSNDGSTIETVNICDDGGSSGGGSSTPTIAEQVEDFTNDIQEVIDTISDGDINAGYALFMALYPEALILEHNGASAKGIYASFGGLWFGGANLIPIGGTIGFQFVVDSYGILAVQLFVGAGIHVIPHADVIGYAMYYEDDLHYWNLSGVSGQVTASLLSTGVTGEYIFKGGYYGYGMSLSIFSTDIFNLNFQLAVEVQYTDTIYVGPSI